MMMMTTTTMQWFVYVWEVQLLQSQMVSLAYFWIWPGHSLLHSETRLTRRRRYFYSVLHVLCLCLIENEHETACSVALQMSCELMCYCKQSVLHCFYYYILMVEYSYPSLSTKRDKYMHLCCGVVVEWSPAAPHSTVHIHVMTLGMLFTFLCHQSV